MAAVKELLRAETDGTLSFGDYTLDNKTKLDGFDFQGDIYKVKTFILLYNKIFLICSLCRKFNFFFRHSGNDIHVSSDLSA